MGTCGTCRRSTTTESASSERLVDELLKACWALEDWLYDDDHITPRITKQELDEHVQGSKALTVCAAYANTSKHGKRNSPAELHARIKGFRIRSGVTKS